MLLKKYLVPSIICLRCVQVWGHLVSLLRLGLVTSSLTRGGRVSSLVTQHLARTAAVLLRPLDPLYRTVCR